MALQLLLQDIDGVPSLCSPAVGKIISLADNNDIIGNGDTVAEISILGVRHQLVLPSSVRYRIVFADNIALGRGIEYQQIVASLVDVVDAKDAIAEVTTDDSSELCVLSPQAGRFYHRPSPDADAFVEAGEEIRAGKTIGLLEVMKTFSPIKWIPAPGNPQTAVVGDYRIADGDDVEDSQPLLNLKPSS
jgi:biotin carboxyl carrier protein